MEAAARDGPLVVPEANVAAAPQDRACCECISRGAIEHVLSLAAGVVEYLLAGKGHSKGTPKEAGEAIASKCGISVRRMQQVDGENINKTLWKEREPSLDGFADEAERPRGLRRL